MKQVLDLIIQNALPEGTSYSVNQTETELGVTFEIDVPEEFRGKIIGRSGVNIKAIRDILNIIAHKQNRRIFLKLVD